MLKETSRNYRDYRVAVVSGGYGHLSGDLLEQKMLPIGLPAPKTAWSALNDVGVNTTKAGDGTDAPSQHYEPRSGATLTPLGGGSEAYLYGGFAVGVAVSELYKVEFSPAGELNWTPQSASGGGAEEPPGRSAHAAVSLSAADFFVFGGFGADGCTNDLWSYAPVDGSAGACQWRCLEPSGDVPAARSGHSMVALDKDRFLLFGGVGGDGVSFADLHIYDGKENTWQALDAADGPGPRYNHRAVVAGGAMMVTGGCVDEVDEGGDGMGMGSATGQCFSLSLAGL